MDQIPASIPFHVARAYGLSARPATQIEVKPTPAAKAEANTNTAKLVAGIVQGSIEFSENAANSNTPARPATTDSFQLYRHPADKNAAATSLNAGRKIDAQA